jgi:hypothetical protein
MNFEVDGHDCLRYYLRIHLERLRKGLKNLSQNNFSLPRFELGTSQIKSKV